MIDFFIKKATNLNCESIGFDFNISAKNAKIFLIKCFSPSFNFSQSSKSLDKSNSSEIQKQACCFYGIVGIQKVVPRL